MDPVLATDHLAPYKFQKGHPSNGGRPKGIAAAVKELVGNNGEKCLEFLCKVMEGQLPGTKMRDRVDATKELLARGFGRSLEVHAHALVDGEASDETRQLATEALLKLAAASAPKLPAQTVDAPASLPSGADTPEAQASLPAEKDE